METQLTTALDQLHHALEQLREGSLQTIDRMESSALFTEESCSFSQTELIDSLSIWMDKAQRLLEV
jgi:hypothetical protein